MFGEMAGVLRSQKQQQAQLGVEAEGKKKGGIYN